MLKGILKDHEFSPNEEIEEPIAFKWNCPTSDDVQSTIRN
jgi:hypothetical protein